MIRKTIRTDPTELSIGKERMEHTMILVSVDFCLQENTDYPFVVLKSEVRNLKTLYY